jgi:glucose-6-phosphate isomerase
MATRLSFRSGLFKALEGDVRQSLSTQRVVERIEKKDHTLWKPAPAEIVNRLGWLDSPRKMVGRIAEIDEIVDGVRSDGYDFALVLGMGGSSLAPEVFRKIFGVAEGYLNLEILDSTDPCAVVSYASCIDFEKTLFVVSTKSGGTIETLSLMKYFYNRAAEKLGKEDVGKHFVAITDPGSKLEETARKSGFRHVFFNDPEIGGRYSALSFFGLVPARLVGINLERLLNEAEAGGDHGFSEEKTNGALLGGLLGEMSLRGRDKATFVFSGRLAPLGRWIEQLIAESTGKEGKGILPIVEEPYGNPECYGSDRVFCSVRLEGDAAGEVHLRALARAGHPVADLVVADCYELAGHFFFWEMATAVACWRLGVNPFDQPNVEAAKVLARNIIAKYCQDGSLFHGVKAVKTDGLSVYGCDNVDDPDHILREFISRAMPCSYVAFMVYLAPSPWIDEALRRLRASVVERFTLATTFGYGPGFLHSTGQLYKGDAGHGLFVQFTADDREDVAVPDELGQKKAVFTFGVLKEAQASGDMQALTEAGRKVLRIHFHGDPARGIARLADALGSDR